MTDRIRIALADDDDAMRAIMRRVVEKAGGYEVVLEASDGDQLLNGLANVRADVVLMDIEMPGKTGIECARVIQDTDPKTVIVFATAHEQYMGDAFQVYAFDYLVKPFKVERMMHTLALIRERLAGEAAPVESPGTAVGQAPKRLMLKHRDGVNFVDTGDILLVQREERSTVMYTADGKRYVIPETLSEIMEKLPQEAFLRSHKSYIISIDAIDSISPYGRWTYVVKLRGTTHDALITHEKFEELERRFS
ncbi:MAG: LytTR family DNA-binding domain-containing protein [Clostridia bacterium]|nr:LytTR family DNA-binding domain-containing protein [Clostridia bacterium]